MVIKTTAPLYYHRQSQPWSEICSSICVSTISNPHLKVTEEDISTELSWIKHFTLKNEE